MTATDWRSAPRRPAGGFATVPASARAFEAGTDVLHVPSGTAVRILLVDYCADEPRPYVVAGDPARADQRRVAEGELAPLTRAAVNAQIRTALGALTRYRQHCPAFDRQRDLDRIAALRATRDALGIGA